MAKRVDQDMIFVELEATDVDMAGLEYTGKHEGGAMRISKVDIPFLTSLVDLTESFCARDGSTDHFRG